MAKVKARQHERLRVPEGWQGQARALIQQLERIHDDIYNLMSVHGEIPEEVQEFMDSTTEALEDVVTISPQTLTASEQDQVQRNIGGRYFRVGDTMYGKTTANLITDVAAKANGIYLYLVSGVICGDLFGDSDSTGCAIITKTSNGYANYIATNGDEMGCGWLNLSTSTVSIHYSSITMDLLNPGNSRPDVTVSSSTNTNLTNIALTKGQYLIVATVDWASNTSGHRRIWLSASSGGDQLGIAASNFVAPCDGTTTRQNLPYLYKASSDTTLYLVGRQTSGSSLLARTRVQIYRLK